MQTLEQILNRYVIREKEYLEDVGFFQAFKIAEDTALLMPYLSDIERVRASKISHYERRQAYITGHALCRILLTLVMDVPVDTLEFELNAMGKPCVKENIYFNISYAEGVCLIGVSTSHEIGIDIAYREKEPIDDLPSEYLHTNEIRKLKTKNKKERYLSFLEMWTYKESVSKALGLGFCLDFSLIDSSLNWMDYEDKSVITNQKYILINEKEYNICFSYIQ